MQGGPSRCNRLRILRSGKDEALSPYALEGLLPRLPAALGAVPGGVRPVMETAGEPGMQGAGPRDRGGEVVDDEIAGNAAEERLRRYQPGYDVFQPLAVGGPDEAVPGVGQHPPEAPAARTGAPQGTASSEPASNGASMPVPDRSPFPKLAFFISLLLTQRTDNASRNASNHIYLHFNVRVRVTACQHALAIRFSVSVCKVPAAVISPGAT